MKKLMILAAVAMAAVCSQAATIKWSISDAVSKAEDGYLVYLVSTSQDFTSVDEIKANLLPKDSLSNSGKIAAGRSGEMFTNSTGNQSWTDGQEIPFYFVILNSKTEADATGYWITPQMKASAVATGTPTSANYSTLGTLATDANLKSFGGDVPEPTSAMLILLGMAGLALKRKQV